MKGNPREGCPGLAWDLPEGHETRDIGAANGILEQGGVPLGVVYQAEPKLPLEKRVENMNANARVMTAQEMLNSYIS